MVTRNGTIKRTALPAYRNVRKGGIIAINLEDVYKRQVPCGAKSCIPAIP